MANTRFFLDKRAVKEPEQAILKIVIAHQTSSALISLVKINVNQWDAENEKIVNHTDSVTLNSLISYKRSVIDRVIIKLMHDDSLRNLTAAQVKNKCMEELEPERKVKREKEAEEKTTFQYRFKRYASRMSNGSKRTYDHTLNRLEAFCSSKGQKSLDKLKFEDITIDWLLAFDKFMAEKGACKNSRNIHYRNMRAVFNEAIDDNITSAYPFRRFKIKNEVTAKRDLTVEELRQLIFFDCEEHAKKYRDYFILMFMLIGVNNVDLCKLKEIVKGRVEFHRTKTNHFFSMKIEPEAMAIIKKYKGANQLLDILDHWSTDEAFRKKMNKTLQKIGPVTRSGLGGKKSYQPIFPKLTTYYARHSWASIASSLDIPMETISAGLGHEYGNRITAIYINYDYRKVDIANRKVIDWVLYGIKDGEVVVKPGTPEFFGLDKEKAIELGLVDESTLQEKTKVEKKKRGRPKKAA